MASLSDNISHFPLYKSYRK